MTKAELIDEVLRAAGGEMSKRKVGELIDATFETIAKDIKKNKKFSYPGFGTWEVRKRKARKGRNPQTGEAIKIKASKTVGFKPHTKLKTFV